MPYQVMYRVVLPKGYDRWEPYGVYGRLSHAIRAMSRMKAEGIEPRRKHNGLMVAEIAIIHDGEILAKE